MTRILISAGETSGDAHAAEVVRALGDAAPELEVEAVGGSCLRAAGATVIEPIEALAVMGLAEPLKSIPVHLALLRRLRRRLASGRYDLVVLVDYPGFHLRLAAAAARRRIPVLYYIAPQLWAWGEWRTRTIRRTIRSLAVVLPFEESFFSARGITATFVGHPLLDRAAPPARHAARQELGLNPDGPVLGLFPGSRDQEIGRMWPPFRDASERLRRMVPNLQVVVAGTATAQYPRAERFMVWRGDASLAFTAADAGLCKSGTTTLEAALYGLPLVISYRMHPLTYVVARRMVRVPRVGLVNLILDRSVAPELLQRAATAGALADAVLPLLDRDGAPARHQRDAFREIRSRLGDPGAGRRVAEMALQLVA